MVFIVSKNNKKLSFLNMNRRIEKVFLTLLFLLSGLDNINLEKVILCGSVKR
jgi:hypothetical protein